MLRETGGGEFFTPVFFRMGFRAELVGGSTDSFF